MNLKKWMDETSRTVTGLAEELGKSRQALHAYLSGEYVPDDATAAKIEELSEGLVEASGWCRGLHDKYRVTKRSGKTEAGADYFVLRLDTDESARIAAMVYAHACKDADLFRDLMIKIAAYESIPLDQIWKQAFFQLMDMARAVGDGGVKDDHSLAG